MIHYIVVRGIRSLGSFLPGGEILLLLSGESVNFYAHGREFQARDFLVQIFRQCVNNVLEFPFIIHELFCREGLVGKTHVHDFGRVAFGRDQVN